MVNTYTININNQSGSVANYTLFTEVPQVTANVQPKLWSNVFASATAGRGQPTVFTVYKQFYAVLGNSHGTPASGVTVSVSDKRPVTLGHMDNISGKTVDGDTQLMISVNQIPEFDPDQPPNAGKTGAFAFKTDDRFDVSTAKSNNWIIGLGGADSGGNFTGPSAVFVPEPNQTYQIQPKVVYYLTEGKYTPGNIIDRQSLNNDVLKLDFTSVDGNGTKNVVHTPNGHLVPSDH
ncbi:hypothetical protein CABS01_01151 [Colletotrichum abscissum]|uniref:Uncharacterized protein n=1 Tax=Colletotrichum abscissum TaxID=1671311 RepID=A0A9P9XC94_9PEZI|nr:uncharacterized protein CABS01_01151 [Colletotrichum abscissum]KAI3546931.1 hypothetical protein CABS02_08780 [Colletotrichum abscissum]KAK1505683.1 hypothetical protein CABS01_01151 [Colletotrichum abscissum]